MNLRLLIKNLGAGAIGFGLIVLIPAFYSIFSAGQCTKAFLITSLLCLCSGAIMWGWQRRYQVDFDNKTALAMLSLSWLAVCAAGALPFLLSRSVGDPLSAFFESTSGFTGTGASVMADVEALDHGLLLWRSMTQWLGGIAIVIFALTFLPSLGLGGIQRFKAEAAGPQKDRVAPRAFELGKKLCLLYAALSILALFALFQGGMSLFDALNHSMTIVSTGGFSTRNAGLAFFHNPEIDLIAAVLMLGGAVNFALYYRFILQGDTRIFHDTELKWFAAVILVAVIFCAATLARFSDFEPRAALRQAFFLVASVSSATGIRGHDLTIWISPVQVIIVVLIVLGGMSGSTAGGLKCIRLAAAFKLLAKQFVQVVHPKAVVSIKANEHTVSQDVIDGIWALLFIYFTAFAIAALVLASKGLDLQSACTAALTALSNTAPALSHLGVALDYAALPPISKFTLIACMLLGRLEFFAILVVFSPAYWRK